MPTAKLSENERFSLALLLELEEDFPGCLTEMANALPAASALGRFIIRVIAPADDADVAA
ncbi:MAG: hypothetical protein JWO33_1266 [Caulobacteraceae bacterium]|nr:hypothetical protein [Caulobacteraceae bacterium]